MTSGLPHRFSPGEGVLAPGPQVPLPPTRMPLVREGRPLKRWRYVGVFDDALMLCVGIAHVGPLRQSFWALWDREAKAWRERTRTLGPGGVQLRPGVVRVNAAGVSIELALREGPGVQTVCAHGGGYVWTRKQGGVPVRGRVLRRGLPALTVGGAAVIDDTAGYHARETEWWWSAGVGRSNAGQAVAWNLVSGVNDPQRGSERSVWVDGNAHEVEPVRFAADLSQVTGQDGSVLHFVAEAERRHRVRLGPLLSDYRQPFGRFSGTLPGGCVLAGGLGVSEHHRARW